MRFGPGGEGKVGEKGEEFEPHLQMVSVGAEVACGGLSAGGGGRRRPCVAAAPHRRGEGGLAGLRSFTERLGRYWGYSIRAMGERTGGATVSC